MLIGAAGVRIALRRRLGLRSQPKFPNSQQIGRSLRPTASRPVGSPSFVVNTRSRFAIRPIVVVGFESGKSAAIFVLRVAPGARESARILAVHDDEEPTQCPSSAARTSASNPMRRQLHSRGTPFHTPNGKLSCSVRAPPIYTPAAQRTPRDERRDPPGPNSAVSSPPAPVQRPGARGRRPGPRPTLEDARQVR